MQITASVTREELEKTLGPSPREEIRQLMDLFLPSGESNQTHTIHLIYANTFENWADLRTVHEFKVGELVPIGGYDEEIQEINLRTGELKVQGIWYRAYPMFKCMVKKTLTK